MTPLQLQMLLHYWIMDEPYAAHNPRHNCSSAVFEQRNILIRQGLLEVELNNSGYIVTERGKFYLKTILATPLPIQKWVMP